MFVAPSTVSTCLHLLLLFQVISWLSNTLMLLLLMASSVIKYQHTLLIQHVIVCLLVVNYTGICELSASCAWNPVTVVAVQNHSTWLSGWAEFIVIPGAVCSHSVGSYWWKVSGTVTTVQKPKSRFLQQMMTEFLQDSLCFANFMHIRKYDERKVITEIIVITRTVFVFGLCLLLQFGVIIFWLLQMQDSSSSPGV